MADKPIDAPPRPRRAPRSRASEAIVEAVLDAAEELIAGDGYAPATTNAIAERAGVSIGSLYQYFPDKHAVVAELARRIERRGLELAMRRAAETAPLDARSATALWVDLLLSPELGPPAVRRALILEAPPLWILERVWNRGRLRVALALVLPLILSAASLTIAAADGAPSAARAVVRFALAAGLSFAVWRGRSWAYGVWLLLAVGEVVFAALAYPPPFGPIVAALFAFVGALMILPASRTFLRAQRQRPIAQPS